MNQLIVLQRENRLLKEHLQDAVALATKQKSNMGLIDQEELSRLNAKANGQAYIPKNWDFTDKNGEQ